VTGIVDRLASRQLVTRERSTKDRRVVTVAITDAGLALVAQAPSPLQDRFTAELGRLPREEREKLRDTLETIVRMMGGGDIDAAPILASDPLPPPVSTPPRKTGR